jgi:hypothetical protein
LPFSSLHAYLQFLLLDCFDLVFELKIVYPYNLMPSLAV